MLPVIRRLGRFFRLTSSVAPPSWTAAPNFPAPHVAPFSKVPDTPCWDASPADVPVASSKAYAAWSPGLVRLGVVTGTADVLLDRLPAPSTASTVYVYDVAGCTLVS